MANGLEPEHLERTITLRENVEAPVTKGQKLGTMDLSYDGVLYGSVDLLASYDVEASKSMVFMRDLQLFFARRDVQLGLIALAVLIVLLIVWIVILSRRRSRYGRSSGYRGGRRR